MTVYNAEPWLRQAIDSIIGQTYPDWELIIVDDGSTDRSPSIVASYADPRVRVVTVAENMGRTPALRCAFEHARGEYIAILDADDLADPARFAKQVDYLDVNGDVSVVGTWTIRIDEHGDEVGRWAPTVDPHGLQDQLGYENPVVHSAAMYRADLAREVGGYPTEYPYAQDSGLWLRLAQRGRIGMIDEFLSYHRTVAGGMTRSKESQVMVSRDRLALLGYAAVHLPLSASARRRNREERTIARCRYGISLLRARHVRAGLAVLGHAIVADPPGVIWNRVFRAAVFG
jgi:glycosyltransferase involved in cell wall biosynthesis